MSAELRDRIYTTSRDMTLPDRRLTICTTGISNHISPLKHRPLPSRCMLPAAWRRIGLPPVDNSRASQVEDLIAAPPVGRNETTGASSSPSSADAAWRTAGRPRPAPLECLL